MRCFTIGTGSPRLSVERAGACVLARVDGEGLLFDCGPGATLRLHSGRFSSQSIGHLFLSHHHYDHTSADKDINLVFPIDRLRELAEARIIGGVARTHIGYMGYSHIFDYYFSFVC